MRTSRVVTVGIAMVGIFLCWFNTVHAGPSLWPNNKGEICLHNVNNGEDARLAVIHTIGNHYIVHGFVTESDGNKTLLNGNAVVNGNKVSIHFSASGYAGTMDKNEVNVTEAHGIVGRVELDASDLTGSVVGVGFHCDDPPQGDPPSAPGPCNFSNDGVQQLVPCQ